MFVRAFLVLAILTCTSCDDAPTAPTTPAGQSEATPRAADPASAPQPIASAPLAQSTPPVQPTAQTPAPTPAQPAFKFTKLSIQDAGINNMEAVSFLIPAGWKHEGGIQWFPDYSILANLLLKITDPQTGAQIEFLPIQKFTHITNPIFPMQPFSNYMGMIVCQPITDAPQFIQTMYAPKAAPQLQNARVVTEENLQKVAEQIAQTYQGQSQVKAARVRYTYDVDGKPWEEDVYVTLIYTPWQMGVMWTVDSAYSFRAPQGQLDHMTPVMMTTVKTCKLSLDWYAQYCEVQKLFNNRMMQGIRDASQLSRIISKNADETRQLYADAYKQRQESQDRINQSFGEYIKGVDTYKNPYEDKPIELPAGYKDAWVNPAGEYILSEQQSFDPNVGSTSEWRRMDKRQ